MPKSSDEHQIDDFYAFFTCCFHLRDWLVADPMLDQAIGAAAKKLVKTNEWLKLGADVANGSKHLALTKCVRVDATAHVHKMEWVFVEPDVLAEDPKRGIKTLKVPMIGVTEGDFFAATVARQSLLAWETFLREHRLLDNP